jgi:hypothetical protein
MMFRILAAIAICAGIAMAHPGVGVVVDSRGNIFYTDLKHVWKLDAQGRKSIAVPNVHTHELYLDSSDHLYGEHLWYEGDRTKKWGHRVWRLSPAGELRDVIPATEGFLTRYSFVRDAAGNMYRAGPPDCAPVEISNRTAVCRIAPGGAVTRVAGGLSDIRWMAAAPNGAVYWTDGGNLWRVTPGGAPARVASNLGQHRSVLAFLTGDRHALMGLWPDANGDVYLAATGARQLLKITPEGSVSVLYRAPAPYAPTGVTVTKSEVVVLEYAGTAARIRRLRRDGSLFTRQP